MNVETNAYYRLEGVAYFVWRELARTPSFDDLCGAIKDVYQIANDIVTNDLEELLRDLLRKGLIVRTLVAER